MKKNFAFTIAEVMITLTIIGIISALTLTAAIHSKPNNAVMKFKKAHNTLFQVVSKLISSDKYYVDGDLGQRRNSAGELEYVDGSYFCKCLADTLSTKKANCNYTIPNQDYNGVYFSCHFQGTTPSNDGPPKVCYNVPAGYVEERVDFVCKNTQEYISEDIGITTTDGIVFFEPTLENHFGCKIKINEPLEGDCTYKSPDWHHFHDTIRMYNDYVDIVLHNDGAKARRAYKVFCIDIDGLNNGEDPFGYGIRGDGKILVGEKAQKWLKKDIQGEE